MRIYINICMLIHIYTHAVCGMRYTGQGDESKNMHLPDGERAEGLFLCDIK